jgi:hypothetical protein
VHIKNGSTFCTELENKLVQAQDKVFYFLIFQIPLDLTSCRYALIVALILV